MKHQYRIDSERNLIIKKYSGRLTVDDEIAIVNQIVADPKYRKGLDVCCDLSEAAVDWSLEELDRFRAFVSRLKKITGPHKWAILIPQGNDNTTVRIFMALHDAMEDTIEVRMFRDRSEALEWLHITAST